MMLATFAAFAQAGPAVTHFRSDKKAVVPKEELYRAGEIQLDVIAAYAVGRVDRSSHDVNGPLFLGNNNQPPAKLTIRDHVDHGWGGGVGVNYFFTRNWGAGLEGYWLDAHGAIHAVLGDLIYRYPFELERSKGKPYGLAPYGLLSVGGQFDGMSGALFGIGGGLEARWCRNGAVFSDARWILHDHDLNYALIRLGVRFIF